MMKLLVAIVSRDDAPATVEALTRDGLGATIIDARGGLVREGVAAILAGVDDRAVPHALAIVERHCQRRASVAPIDMRGVMQEWSLPEVVPIETGGATIFVVRVARFERF